MSDQQGPREVAANSLPLDADPSDLEYVSKYTDEGEEHRTYEYFDDGFGLHYRVKVVHTPFGWDYPEVEEV